MNSPTPTPKFTAVRYSPAWEQAWERAVLASKNAAFMHSRRFLSYHGERFSDHSLLILRNQQVFALLPAEEWATEDGKIHLHSHRGLSFGGVLWPTRVRLFEARAVWKAIAQYCMALGMESLHYAPPPRIYHQALCEEDALPLWLLEAHRISVGSGAAIDLSQPLVWQQRRKRCAQKAFRQGIKVRQSHDWAIFWALLEERLLSKYQNKPVHTLEEITLLAARFPANIQLMVAERQGKMLAGTVLFINTQVMHAQYIAGGEEGLSLGALDALFASIQQQATPCRWLSLGTSHQPNGHINEGVKAWKEGWGSQELAYETWLVPFARHQRL